MKEEVQPVFVRLHLRSSEEIAQVFGVTLESVREWRKQGAPIVSIGKRYQANYHDLWEWLKRQTVEANGGKV